MRRPESFYAGGALEHRFDQIADRAQERRGDSDQQAVRHAQRREECRPRNKERDNARAESAHGSFDGLAGRNDGIEFVSSERPAGKVGTGIVRKCRDDDGQDPQRSVDTQAVQNANGRRETTHVEQPEDDDPQPSAGSRDFARAHEHGRPAQDQGRQNPDEGEVGTEVERDRESGPSLDDDPPETPRDARKQHRRVLSHPQRRADEDQTAKPQPLGPKDQGHQQRYGHHRGQRPAGEVRHADRPAVLAGASNLLARAAEAPFAPIIGLERLDQLLAPESPANRCR